MTYIISILWYASWPVLIMSVLAATIYLTKKIKL